MEQRSNTQVIWSLNGFFWKHLSLSPQLVPVHHSYNNRYYGWDTLVRLGKGVLPLQKLLHFVIILGKTLVYSKNKKSDSPIWFKTHYLPSGNETKRWFWLPVVISAAGGGHRWPKLIPLHCQLPSYWATVLHGPSLLARLFVNQSARFLLVLQSGCFWWCSVKMNRSIY